MATTVLELITNLKHYPDKTEIIIRDVHDEEFVIVDFKLSENNILIITIGEVTDDVDDDEE